MTKTDVRHLRKCDLHVHDGGVSEIFVYICVNSPSHTRFLTYSERMHAAAEPLHYNGKDFPLFNVIEF